MKTIIGYIILIFVIIMGVSTYTISTNLKKNTRPLYLLICVGGTVIGILVGVLRDDIYSGLQVGLLLTLLYIFGSAIGRWQRQKFTNLEEWHKKRFKK